MEKIFKKFNSTKFFNNSPNTDIDPKQKLKQLKVLVIGELIIDRYFFGKVLGKSGKEPHLVMEENYSEDYLGGSAAVARHLSSFVKKIDLLSPYGGEKKHNLLIKKHFKNNNLKK